jgi:drug/metabolite transporter (DMT)-like permease
LNVFSLFTIFALFAFASNSLLCRLALGSGAIDAASFTTVRLLSGAAVLVVLQAMIRRASGDPRLGAGRPGPAAPTRCERWISAALLFLYAAPFSFAYISLGASTGALILFLCVQTTMLVGAVRSGEGVHWLESAGVIVALGGLIYLVSPGLSAPSPLGSALMVIAGVAWGLYSLRGRRSSSPIKDTADNFIRSVPLAALASASSFILAPNRAHLTPHGLLLAASSGALASGLGYAAWYAALPRLKAVRAAVLQLTVPVITAVGGIVLLSERISLRLTLSAALILGGVAIALAGRAARNHLNRARPRGSMAG